MIIIFVILILFTVIVIGCTKGQKGNTGTTTKFAATKHDSSSAMEGTQAKFAEEQKVKSVLKVMIESFEKKDVAMFKQIISPKGVVIIRSYIAGNNVPGKATPSNYTSGNKVSDNKTSQNYASGNSTGNAVSGSAVSTPQASDSSKGAQTAKGINYRGIFSGESFPESFTVELDGDILFKPERYFLNIERYNVADIPAIKLDKYKFDFKDNMYNHILEPDTIKIWNICAGIRENIGSENNWMPYLILTNSGEAAFSISETGLNTGNWAIFEKVEDKYYLRALLDFR